MKEIFDRNYAYVTPDEQEKIKSVKVLLAGAGIGSNIAECLVRFGFARLTIIDKDVVDSTNLNRQNYVADDISKSKAATIARRLKSINPDADIRSGNLALSETNLPGYMNDCDYIINTLDFDDGLTFACNRLAGELGKPALFPLNLGWMSALYVFLPGRSETLQDVLQKYKVPAQDALVLEIMAYLAGRNRLPDWFVSAYKRYKQAGREYDPQLAVGSFSVAASVTATLYGLVTGRPVPTYPDPIIHDHMSHDRGGGGLFGPLRSWIFLRRVKRLLRNQVPQGA